MPEKNAMTLCMDDFAIVDDKILFSNVFCNGLFQADLRTGKADLIGVFPNEELLGWHLYSSIHVYGKKLIFIPCWAKELAVYDMENNVILKLPYSELDLKSRDTVPCFSASILVGKYVYAFGGDIPKIVRINMETMDIRGYVGWAEELYKFGKVENDFYFNMDVCQKGNSLFVATRQNNSILEFDMGTDKITIHHIGKEGVIYNTLAYDGKYFWLTGSSKEILRVDSDNWECCYRRIEGKVHFENFFRSIYLHSEVWLFSTQLNSLYKINCDNFSLSEKKINFDEEDKWFPNKEKYGYSSAKKIGNCQFAVACAEDVKIHILENGSEIYSIKIYIGENVRKFYENWYFQKRKDKKGIKENGSLFGQVRSFIHNFECMKDASEIEEGKLVYGRRVYNFVNKSLKK